MSKSVKSVNILVSASLLSSSLMPLATAMERADRPDPLSGHHLSKEQKALYEKMMASQSSAVSSDQKDGKPASQPPSTLQAIWDNSAKVWQCYRNPEYFVKASLEDFICNYTGNVLTKFLKGNNNQLELNTEAIAKFLTIVGDELQEKALPVITPLFQKPRIRLENGIAIEYYDLGEKERTFFSGLADSLIPNYITGRQILIAGLNNPHINEWLMIKMNQRLVELFFKLYEHQTNETVTEGLTKLLGATTNKAINFAEAFPSKLMANGIQLGKIMRSLMEDYLDVGDLPTLSVDENEAQLSPLWSYFKPHIDELARNAIHSIVKKTIEGAAQMTLEKIIGPVITNWALTEDRKSLLDVSYNASFNVLTGSYVSGAIAYNYLGDFGFILGGACGAIGGLAKSAPDLIKYFGPQVLATSVKTTQGVLLNQYVPNMAEYISHSAVPQSADGYSLYHQYNHQWTEQEISAFPEDFKRVQRFKSTYFMAELLKTLVNYEWFHQAVDSVVGGLEGSAQILWQNIKALVGSEEVNATLSAEDIMRLLDEGKEKSEFSTAPNSLQILLGTIDKNPALLQGLVRPYWAEQERLKRLSMEWNLCSKGDLEKKLKYLAAFEQKAEQSSSERKNTAQSIDSGELGNNLSNHFVDGEVQSALKSVLGSLNWNAEARMYLNRVAHDQDFMDSFMRDEETIAFVKDFKKQTDTLGKEAIARKLLDRLVTSYHQQGQGVYALLKERFSDDVELLVKLDDLKKTSFWQEVCMMKNSTDIVEEFLTGSHKQLELLHHIVLGANKPDVIARYREEYQQRIVEKVNEIIEFQKRNTLVLFSNHTVKTLVENKSMELHETHKEKIDFRKNMLEFINNTTPNFMISVQESKSKPSLQAHIKNLIDDIFEITKQNYEKIKEQGENEKAQTASVTETPEQQGFLSMVGLPSFLSSTVFVSNESSQSVASEKTIIPVNDDWGIEDFNLDSLVVKELKAFKNETKLDGEIFYIAREFNNLLTLNKFESTKSLEDILSSKTNQKTLLDHLIAIRSAGCETPVSELLALMINDPYYDHRVFLAPLEMGQKIRKLKHSFLHQRKR